MLYICQEVGRQMEQVRAQEGSKLGCRADHIEWDLIPRFNAPRELFVIYRVH